MNYLNRNWKFPVFRRSVLFILFRNFLVWKKTAFGTILGDILDPMVALLALGYGLGQLMTGSNANYNGISYITYLSAGSICLTVLYSAAFEATYNSFSRLQIQRTWEAILNTPMSLDDIILAEILWSAIKGIKSGVFMLLMIICLNISREPYLVFLPIIICLAGIAFASMSMILTAMARGYEFFLYYFTLIITPMVFLSGVYFPTNLLPKILTYLFEWLPLSPAIKLARPLIMGQLPNDILINILQLICTGIFCTWISTLLLRYRFFN